MSGAALPPAEKNARRRKRAAATAVIVRHTTYQVGSVVGCAVCSEVWPCYDVRQARKVLDDK